MPAAASSIPAAKAAIKALLNATPALDACVKEWGQPAKAPADLDQIWIGDAIDIERQWRSLGRGGDTPVDEEFRVEVTVECYRAGDDPQGTEEAAWALFAAIELAIRSNTNLSGTVRVALPVIDRQTLEPLDNGWIATVFGGVSCTSRI